MTRLGQAGFGLGDTLAYGADTAGSTSGSVALVTATPAPRTGAYCLKCAPGTGSSTGSWTTHAGRKTFAHASKSEMWYAFAAFFHHPSAVTTPGPAFFVAYDAGGNYNLVLTNDAGTIRAYYCTANAPTTVGTNIVLIGSASASASMDAWHLLEVRIVAATGATGTLQVYLDGASVISATSQRTAQSSATLGSFSLGSTNAPVGTTGLSAFYHGFADVRYQDTAGSVNNGRPGDEVVRLLVPDGAGSSAGMTRGGTDSGANWSQTEEVPPSLADYVYHATVGTKDLYTMSSPGALTSCSAVQVLIYAQNSDAGAGSVTMTVKTPAGEAATGSATALSAAATYYRSPVLETDPSGGAAWDSTKLAALEAGVVVA